MVSFAVVLWDLFALLFYSSVSTTTIPFHRCSF